MASIERDAIESALTKKGYEFEPGGNHRYYRLFVAGKKTQFTTKVSMGTKYKTLGEPLVALMAGQMALTAKQLHQFVECTMSGGDYVEVLRALGKLARPVEKAALTDCERILRALRDRRVGSVGFLCSSLKMAQDQIVVAIADKALFDFDDSAVTPNTDVTLTPAGLKAAFAVKD